MKLALCNEVLGDRELADQCEYAAALGYRGLELAPYTLDELPHKMAADKRRDIRRTIEASGLVVSGLHWLLVIPQDLSITSADVDVRAKTRQVMCSLVILCADLGGAVLVHGSPKQRWLSDDPADYSTFTLEDIGLTPSGGPSGSPFVDLLGTGCFRFFPDANQLRINSLNRECVIGSWTKGLIITGTDVDDLTWEYRDP